MKVDYRASLALGFCKFLFEYTFKEGYSFSPFGKNVDIRGRYRAKIGGR
jgi:hypothetical protein